MTPPPEHDETPSQSVESDWNWRARSCSTCSSAQHSPTRPNRKSTVSVLSSKKAQTFTKLQQQICVQCIKDFREDSQWSVLNIWLRIIQNTVLSLVSQLQCSCVSSMRSPTALHSHPGLFKWTRANIKNVSLAVLNPNGMRSRRSKICFFISFLKQLFCKQDNNYQTVIRTERVTVRNKWQKTCSWVTQSSI